AEHPVGTRVRKNLDKTAGLAERLGAPVSGKGKITGTVIDTGRFERLFGLPGPSNLRRRVDHGRNDVVVHFGVMSGDRLRDHYAFFHSLVSEHGSPHDVS